MSLKVAYRVVPEAQWVEEGTRLFGPDPLFWKFVCPSCGHVQKPEDFRQYKERGATPETGYFSCIGRFLGVEGAFDPQKYRPCNYTSGGLFCINTVFVAKKDGKQIPVFDFYREIRIEAQAQETHQASHTEATLFVAEKQGRRR